MSTAATPLLTGQFPSDMIRKARTLLGQSSIQSAASFDALTAHCRLIAAYRPRFIDGDWIAKPKKTEPRRDQLQLADPLRSSKIILTGPSQIILSELVAYAPHAISTHTICGAACAYKYKTVWAAMGRLALRGLARRVEYGLWEATPAAINAYREGLIAFASQPKRSQLAA